ncbi:MAG: acyl-CoA reductase [Cellulophaga sp.]
MTDLKHRFEAFVKLGTFLKSFCDGIININKTTTDSSALSLEFKECISQAKHYNGWFTEENILFCLNNWADALTKENLEEWLTPYNLNNREPKNVALIMAGNIPLVGFHDFLVTLITGHNAIIKLSSNDKTLLPFIAKILLELEPSLKNNILFTEERLENYDAVIATGSTNTARYFEHYFSKKPNIIRKSRNSVAVLTGEETKEQLKALGEDIFRYYGLGCRSVSKLFVPKGYNFDAFFEAIYNFNPIINQNKYANNYDYNKAVYLMSEYKLLENGFLMLKEDERNASPIASVFYEFYENTNSLKKKLEENKKNLQCIVASNFVENEVPFGKTQLPTLNDFADNVDTIKFLISL